MNKRLVVTLTAAFTMILALTASKLFAAQPAAAPEAAPLILIQNATILTVSHGTIEHGSILIKDGKSLRSANP